MTIHFVCVGNTYRSRLAEEYFNSLCVPNWQAVSSGVQATRNLNGPLCRYTKAIFQENNLGLSTSDKGWTQTTRENLERSDLVIFMHQNVFDLCKKEIRYIPKNFVVWDIADIDFKPKNEEESDQALAIARDTFRKIQTYVDDSVQNL